MIITTGITVDEPTINGNLYPRNVMEDAVERFNKRARVAPISGGILNRAHIQRIGDPIFETTKMFINESGVLCAEINLLEDDGGEETTTIKNKIVNNKIGIIGRPLLSVPSYALEGPDGKKLDTMVVSKINDIVRVQIELKELKDAKE